MFARIRILAALAALAFVPAALAGDLTAGMKKGTPEMKSAGALAFGPEGILFVADAPNATIFAIATEDTKAAGTKSISIPKIDEVDRRYFGHDRLGDCDQRFEGESRQRQRVCLRRPRQGPDGSRRDWSRSMPKARRPKCRSRT